MGTDRPATPYGSALDLPSFKAMNQQISALQLLGLFLSADQRRQLRSLKRERRRIASVIDSFYQLLGVRNWVFTGSMQLEAMEQISKVSDPDVAERQLIVYYKTANRIAFEIMRLNRFPALRTRMDLLENARIDYEAGRFYSVVLVILTVMDGFVNDMEVSARSGLHARSVDEMNAWDSVVGHHLGLSHAHRSFIKGHYKTDATPVVELSRNGIIHGTLPNFDNEIVATKAWNRLFAVADWADARQRQALPTSPMPSFTEMVRDLRTLGERKAFIDAWEASEHAPRDDCEVTISCSNFLEAWKRTRWDLVGATFMQFGSSGKTGKLAREARELYSSHLLSEWKIHSIRHEAPGVSITDVELVVNKGKYRTSLRWVRQDEENKVVTQAEAGRWTLSQYGPTLFVTEERLVAD